MIVGAAAADKDGESTSKITQKGDGRPSPFGFNSALISTASGRERGYLTKPRPLPLAVLIFLNSSQY